MTTVGALAALVDGTVVGDSAQRIDGVADLASAGPTDISFLANPKYAPLVTTTKAGALIVAAAIEAPCPQIVCSNPYLAMQTVAVKLFPSPSYPAGVEPGAFVHAKADIHPTAVVRAGAVVDAGALVGARTVVQSQAYVGADTVIGADCYLHPGARVLHRCILGDRVILHANAVIGSDGFGYAPDATGKRHKIPQVGIVVLEDDVEVGAGTTIDRATFGKTRIGTGTKIDNLVQIAHNVSIGRDCVIVAQSGIAGSSSLGDRVIAGAQTGIVGHIKITDDVMLAARAGVPNNITRSGVYSGAPIQPHAEWVKSMAVVANLPELRRRVRDLEKKKEG